MLFACISYGCYNRDGKLICANCKMKEGIYGINYNNNVQGNS